VAALRNTLRIADLRATDYQAIFYDGRFLVEGHDVTSFTNEEEQAERTAHIVPFSLEDKLAERGGRFKKAHKMQTNVVSSGRLVTGQNPASAMGTAEAVIALLAVQNHEALCSD
jgi:putative intracellular protease/amidase